MNRFSRGTALLLVSIVMIGIASLLFMYQPITIILQPSSEQAALTMSAAIDSPLPTPTEDLDNWQNNYEFGEPQIVLHSPTSFAIVGWLPDGQKVLVVEGDPTDDAFYLIKTYDLLTQEPVTYGRFGPTHPRVAWLEDVQKVAYIGYDGKANALVIAGKDAADVVVPILRYAGTMDARDNLVVALEQNGPSSPVAFDGKGVSQQIPVVDVREYGIDLAAIFWKMRLHPIEPNVAFFNQSGFVIFDMQHGDVRPIDLGEETSESISGRRWALDAKWSPDGKQLAFLMRAGELPLGQTKLFVMELASEKLEEIPIPTHYISDIQWAPNGQQLLIGGEVMQWGDSERADDPGNKQVLLVDIASHQHIEIEQLSRNYIQGDTGMSMQWSSDGSKLLTRCGYDSQPENAAICLTDVRINNGSN